MPDVFISYNREDRDRASVIASALEAEGFSVWWDAALRAGETYDEVTEQNLRTAGAVVVLWSKRSASSKWVRAEATVGERSSTLVPALIEDCERPIRFELVQTADLRHWRGDRNDPHWRAFMQDVRTAITRRSAKPQPAAAAAPTSEASFETTFWNSIKDGKDSAEFEAYLKRYPQGNFAALAQNRLAALSRVAPAAPAPRPAAPAPQQRPATAQVQRPAPQPRPAPAPEPKKSGGGLLIGGILAGLAVIGVVAFLMMQKPGEPASAAETAPAAIDVAAEAPAASPPEIPATDMLEGGEAIVPPADETLQPPVVETPAKPAAPAEEKTPGRFKDCESCPLMTPIEGGTFTMGSPSAEPGHNAYEGPQREVTVKPFAIGVYELTNAEWKACVDDGACQAKPGSGGEGDLPALFLSWRDATGYASWLSKKTGRKYRLPTEAEWEYAARAGASTAYWWGDSFDRSRVTTSGAVAVGSSAANAFGLYDVAANAREWVADCYVNNFVKAPLDGSAVTEGDCGKRVIRGGAWFSSPADMRIANRSRIDIDVRSRYMGVRLAADIGR
ncbi:MAG: SUMF1/EgtB/PvdO family nonheme iron enzyme [Pseudomonadota bacterium]